MADNQLQTITTETSKKWSLNMPDFLRSSLTALFTAVSAVVLQSLDVWITALQTSGSFTFDKVSFLLALKVAIAAWLGDLVRRLMKSSATVIRVQPGLSAIEPKPITNEDGEGGDSGVEQPPPPKKP